MRPFFALLCSLAVLAAMPSPAAAAKLIGNGGNVFVCPGQIPEVRLLDFVEAEILRGRWIRIADPAPERYSYWGKIVALFTKIEERFPRLGKRLREEFHFFETNHVRLDKVVLDSSGDSFHKFGLEGCRVEQAVNQSEPMFNDDPTFIVSYRLWRSMSEMDKAGIILHEMLYRIGLKNGVEHSLGVRHLNGLLFHENYAEITDRQWMEAFSVARVNYFEKNGFLLPLFNFVPPCRIIPGSMSCDMEKIFQASYAVFDTADSVSAMYYSFPQFFDLNTTAMRIGLTAENATVQYNARNEAELQFSSGDITLFPYGHAGRLEKVAVIQADGALNTRDGHFCGTFKAVKYMGGRITRPSKKFCGKLSDLITKKVRGIN